MIKCCSRVQRSSSYQPVRRLCNKEIRNNRIDRQISGPDNMSRTGLLLARVLRFSEILARPGIETILANGLRYFKILASWTEKKKKKIVQWKFFAPTHQTHMSLT